MASLRDIRQKIKSVKTIHQITNAMRMMSTAKLSRAIESVNRTKPYVNKLLSLARNIKLMIPDFQHPALEEREVNKITTIIIGGERGLCGGFNQELNTFALKEVKKVDLEKQELFVIGQKAIRFFQYSNIPMAKEFATMNVKELETELFTLSKELYNQYKAHKTDKVNLIYTSYISSINHPVLCNQLLPIPKNSDLLEKSKDDSDESSEESILNATYDFYPSPEEIFDQILPRYMFNSLLQAVIESIAAEQSSRMMAMTSATDRANEKLDSLRLELNRSRQAQITQELNEVIAGSQT
ncbi:MAG: ATP synthase F1 subunit gamma [Candidatus Riflebacteria bacterium]|nr:ATP synthase F1 subunit gamma [Candidatus Riflebacteria bacterium]